VKEEENAARVKGEYASSDVYSIQFPPTVIRPEREKIVGLPTSALAPETM